MMERKLCELKIVWQKNFGRKKSVEKNVGDK